MHTMSRYKTGGGAAALLAMAALLLGTRYAVQAQHKQSTALPVEATTNPVAHMTLGTPLWKFMEAHAYSGAFLVRYMAENNIKGEYSTHLDTTEMPTIEGVQKTCILSYQFMGEPERQYNLPVVVTLRNGKLDFLLSAAPYTSDGSDPYQSQKIENKPIQVELTHK